MCKDVVVLEFDAPSTRQQCIRHRHARSSQCSDYLVDTGDNRDARPCIGPDNGHQYIPGLAVKSSRLYARDESRAAAPVYETRSYKTVLPETGPKYNAGVQTTR